VDTRLLFHSRFVPILFVSVAIISDFLVAYNDRKIQSLIHVSRSIWLKIHGVYNSRPHVVCRRAFKLWSTRKHIVRCMIACLAATSGRFPAGLFANPCLTCPIRSPALFARAGITPPRSGNDTQQANFRISRVQSSRSRRATARREGEFGIRAASRLADRCDLDRCRLLH